MTARSVRLCAVLAATVGAHRLDLQMVNLCVRTSPNRTPKKVESVPNLVREANLLVSVDENGNVLETAATTVVTRVEYQTRGGLVLTSHHENPSCQGPFVQPELGGNRDAVSRSIQAPTGKQVTRITGK